MATIDDAISSFDIDAAGTRAVDRSRAAQFGADYDAIKPQGKRRQPAAIIAREDVDHRGPKRIQLSANAADIARNFSIAAWMIRRHLDYVASFKFAAATGDRGLDREIDALIKNRSSREAMDRGGRFAREKFFRLAELRRVVDGDVGLLRLRDGRTQVIESDLVRDPPKPGRSEEWEQGVLLDRAGAQLKYALHRRPRGRGYEYDRTVPGANFYLYGFFDRDAANQTRGVSPIAAALNPLRDVYENIDYAQMRAKIAQLFVAAFTRKSGADSLETVLPTASQNDVEGQNAAAADEPEPRVLDLTKGPTVFDLDDGEDLKIVESETVSPELQAFLQVGVAIALKALDIPYSFYDEAYTNYSGSRGSWLLYDRAAADKRADQVEMRTVWTRWEIQRAIIDGDLLPPSGLDLARLGFDWVPRGMPWWKPSEEVVGTLKAIGGGLDNPFRACQEADRGDFRDNVDRIIEAMKYARDRGLAELGEPLRLNFEAEFPPTIEAIQGTKNG